MLGTVRCGLDSRGRGCPWRRTPRASRSSRWSRCSSSSSISFSPTMTAAVISDTGARGRLSDLVLAIVVLADLVALVLFSVGDAVRTSGSWRGCRRRRERARPARVGNPRRAGVWRSGRRLVRAVSALRGTRSHPGPPRRVRAAQSGRQDPGIRTAAGRHGRRAGDPERRGPAGRCAEGGDPARSAPGARRVLRRDGDVAAARCARSDRVRGAGARRGADRPDSTRGGGRTEGVGDRPPYGRVRVDRPHLTGRHYAGARLGAGDGVSHLGKPGADAADSGHRDRRVDRAGALPNRPGARGRDRDDNAAAPDRRVQQGAVSAQLRQRGPDCRVAGDRRRRGRARRVDARARRRLDCARRRHGRQRRGGCRRQGARAAGPAVVPASPPVAGSGGVRRVLRRDSRTKDYGRCAIWWMCVRNSGATSGRRTSR